MRRLFLSKAIPPERLEALLAGAAASPLADPAVAYPEWYLHRWHFLPDGYLSRSSVGSYDRLIRPLYHAVVEPRSLRTVGSMLERAGPASVLEVGCGPGRAARALLERLPAARYTGIDLSPYMLELAHERLGPGPGLRHACATALPLPDGQFDAVVALHVLGHMPAGEAERALAETVRVLRPRGWLVTVEHRWHQVAWPPALRLVHRRAVGLGFAVLRLHRRNATAGEALAAMRQSQPTSTPGHDHDAAPGQP